MELRLESFVQDTIKRKLDLYHVVVRQHGEIIGKFDWRENRREDILLSAKVFSASPSVLPLWKGSSGW